jgi:hypothetical protein
LDVSARGNASKLIRLRNDVCQIFWEFDEEEKFIPNSFLTKIVKERKKNAGVARVQYLKRIGFLLKGLPESLKMLDCLSKKVTDDNNQISSGDFVAIEATLAYTSFFISMFTKSDSDFLSVMLRDVKNCNARKRKGSSISADSLEEGGMDDDDSDDSEESESGCPDDFGDDDDAEAKLDGISRLHDACMTNGAAPLHPDWLDTSCQLRHRQRLSFWPRVLFAN